MRPRSRKTVSGKPKPRRANPARTGREWTPRPETLLTWGTTWYDANLQEMPYATDDAWLEVRLVREAVEPIYRARLEVRTRLGFFGEGRPARGVRAFLRRIANDQRAFAKRWKLTFPPAGAVQRYVAHGTLTRAYGKRSVTAHLERINVLR